MYYFNRSFHGKLKQLPYHRTNITFLSTVSPSKQEYQASRKLGDSSKISINRAKLEAKFRQISNRIETIGIPLAPLASPTIGKYSPQRKQRPAPLECFSYRSLVDVSSWLQPFGRVQSVSRNKYLTVNDTRLGAFECTNKTLGKTPVSYAITLCARLTKWRFDFEQRLQIAS